MGASISKTVISSMLNNSIDVINSYQQTCLVSPTQQSKISFENCKTGENSNIDLSNQQIIKQDCITNATTQVAIASSVNQAMRQQAQSVVQQYSFGTVSAAEDFINASITLADTITNTYLSQCITQASQDITFDCKNSELNGTISIKNSQAITQSCLLNAITNSTAYQTAVTKFEQSAVAKQQSTFLYILLAFGLILAIGAYFLVSIANTPAVQWGIVAIILFSVISTVIYAVTARSAGNYPYRKT